MDWRKSLIGQELKGIREDVEHLRDYPKLDASVKAECILRHVESLERTLEVRHGN